MQVAQLNGVSDCREPQVHPAPRCRETLRAGDWVIPSRANELVGTSALNLVGKVTCLSAPNLLELCLCADISVKLQTADVSQAARQVHMAHRGVAACLGVKRWLEMQGCLMGPRSLSRFALQALREMDSSPL